MKKLLLLVLTITALNVEAQTWQNVGMPGFSIGTAFDQSIAVNNGTPYVAYKDAANGNKTTVMKYNGTDWEVVGSAGFSQGTASYQSLVFNDDTLYVAFRDDSFSAGTFGGTTVMQFNGSGWVNLGSPGFSAGEANYQSLAFHDEILYVGYQDNSDLFKTAVMKYEAGVWIPLGSATGFSPGVSHDVKLAIDPVDGTPYVAFKDTENSQKIRVMKYDGADWVTVGPGGISEGPANDPSLVIDNGTPYVAYSDNLNGFKTTVMKYNGTDWVTVGIVGFSGVDAVFQTMVIENGILYVGFRDGSNSLKSTVMKFTGGSWTNVGSAGFSAESAAHQSLAIDNGKLYIAFQDEVNSFKTTVMTFDITTGINEQFHQSHFEIYPNPCDNELTIDGEGFLSIETINIIDIAGKIVKTIIPNTNTINIADLQNGIYFLQLQANSKVITRRFVKNNL